MHQLKTKRKGVRFFRKLNALVLFVLGLIVANSAFAKDYPRNFAIESVPGLNSRELTKPSKPLRMYPDIWGYDYSTEPPAPFRRPSNFPSRRTDSASYSAHLMRADVRVANYACQSILDADGRMLPWYLSYLDRFREPLFSRDSKEATLRFVWVREINNPICVTVNFDSPDDSIYGREIVGVKIKHEKRISKLAKAQVNSLKKKIKNAELWKATAAELEPERAPQGPVSIWVLENWDGKSYRHVEQRSPKAGPVRELGLELLKLTELDPETAEQNN